MTKEELSEWCMQELDIADTRLKKFRTQLDASPIQAFEWGMEAVDAAAMRSVMKQVIAALGKEATPKTIEDYGTEQVIHMSLVPPASTSPLSNLAEQSKLKAWASLLDGMKWL